MVVNYRGSLECRRLVVRFFFFLDKFRVGLIRKFMVNVCCVLELCNIGVYFVFKVRGVITISKIVVLIFF